MWSVFIEKSRIAINHILQSIQATCFTASIPGIDQQDEQRYNYRDCGACKKFLAYPTGFFCDPVSAIQFATIRMLAIRKTIPINPNTYGISGGISTITMGL